MNIKNKRSINGATISLVSPISGIGNNASAYNCFPADCGPDDCGPDACDPEAEPCDPEMDCSPLYICAPDDD